MSDITQEQMAAFMDWVRSETTDRLEKAGMLVLPSPVRTGTIRVVCDSVRVVCSPQCWDVSVDGMGFVGAAERVTIEMKPFDFPAIGCRFKARGFKAEDILTPRSDLSLVELLGLGNTILDVKSDDISIDVDDGSVFVNYGPDCNGRFTLNGQNVTEIVSQARIDLSQARRIIDISVRFNAAVRGSIGDPD